MLEQIIQEKHRVLLFSQFVDMLDIIKGWLERSGIPYEYLTGKTKDRQKAGQTAIPDGLYLMKVEYNQEKFSPVEFFQEFE